MDGCKLVETLRFNPSTTDQGEKRPARFFPSSSQFILFRRYWQRGKEKRNAKRALFLSFFVVIPRVDASSTKDFGTSRDTIDDDIYNRDLYGGEFHTYVGTHGLARRPKEFGSEATFSRYFYRR